VFALVATVGVYQTIAGPTQAVPGLLSSGLATIAYVGNWQQIAASSSYFGQTGPVSPLQHTWSLAIEEQFYLLWPLIILGVLRIVTATSDRSGGHLRPLRTLFALSVVGAMASAVEMDRLVGRDGVNRVYLGTDTRAQSLLVGAALALWLATMPRRERGARGIRGAAPRRGRSPIAACGLLGAAALLWAMGAAGSDSTWLYRFGFLGIDVAVAAVILAAVAAPESLIPRVLSIAPVRAVGQISYGLCIWHFPLFLWLNSSSTGEAGTSLVVLRLAATLVVSVGSFVVIEQPIRQRRLPKWVVRPLAPVAAAAASLVAATAVATPVLIPPRPTALDARWTGTASCGVTATDTSQAIVVPPDPGRIPANVIPDPAAYHDSAALTFHTSPPAGARNRRLARSHARGRAHAARAAVRHGDLPCAAGRVRLRHQGRAGSPLGRLDTTAVVLHDRDRSVAT
jgi:peptidoglycan/LPS O-acetylase OafA/YrhL